MVSAPVVTTSAKTPRPATGSAYILLVTSAVLLAAL